MQRRDFVKQASAGLLGASGLAGLAPVTSERRGPSVERTMRSKKGIPLKKAIKLHLVEEDDLTLEEKFDLLAELGFEGVELRGPSGNRSRAEVLCARDRTGLAIHGVLNAGNWSQPLSSPDPSVRAEGVETLKAAIAEAGAYGASTVLLVPAVVNDQVAYDEAWRRSQEAVRRALPAAEKHDVTIAFENVWNHFLLSPMDYARYIDEFESEHVGAYLDIGNTLTYGWPDQWLRILGDRVVKIDVKDRTRERYSGRGQAVRVKLGEGSCNWSAVEQALADIGYEGWATAEVSGGGRARLRDISQRMDQILPM